MDRVNLSDFASFMSFKLGLGEGTIVKRKSHIRIFLKWLDYRDITGKTIEDFFSHSRDRGISNTSLNSCLAALRSYEKYCTDRSICPPFLKGFKSFPEDEVFIDPLSDLEIERLISTEEKSRVDHIYTNFITFIAYTGCRLGEAINIQCKYVDLLEERVTFVRTKMGAPRTVFFVKNIKQILAEQIKDKSPDDYVFTNLRGSKLHQPDFSRYLHKRGIRAGITKPVRPHVLRHSYATASHDDTGDILLVKEIMGHKNINSTLRYIHMSGKRIKNGQVNHPFNQKYIDPSIKISKAEELINSLRLLQDIRFDRLKVKQAIDSFTTQLYQAIINDEQKREVLAILKSVPTKT